jgi:enoyl-CoA hydratase/carnithine racemase
LVGRGRALEIVLGANDFDGDAAERYGYINQALPEAELNGFVDALARCIASFGVLSVRRSISSTRCPYHPPLLDALNSFRPL